MYNFLKIYWYINLLIYNTSSLVKNKFFFIYIFIILNTLKNNDSSIE